MDNLRKHFYSKLEEIYHLNCTEQLLGWDEQVFMPEGGEKSRMKQLELMSTLIHQKRTDSTFTDIVDELAASIDSLDEHDAINVRETKRVVDNARKLSEEFVAKKTRAQSEAYATWIKARPADDFSAVLPFLKQNVSLAKEEAELLGYDESRYDALLDSFEPGSKLSIIEPALLGLAEGLRQILPQIKENSSHRAFTPRAASIPIQEKISLRVINDIGYTSAHGRLDIAPHPFMTAIGPRDTRITTRYEKENYLSSLLTALHEAGHGLYELGFDEASYGTPCGEPVSLSIHESQSRFYENIVGRSIPFSRYLHSVLADVDPELAQSTSPEEIWNSLNHVESSLIRVEADEVTYSLHIVIRTILEKELINDDLPVEELPTRWKELYAKYLEIDVPDDRDGVLQDVHWYHVGFGYFPTYALGNLYGALMLEKIEKDLSNYEQLIAEGDFQPILSWLREEIHQHGMRYHGPEIAQRLSGSQLSHEPFLNYISGKHIKSS